MFQSLKRWVEVFFLGALLATLAVVCFQWAMESFIHSRKEQVLPDLRGKSVLNAVRTLSSLSLPLLKEGEEFDDAIPPGAILRQYPDPESIVREGKVIRVVLSHGGETVFVPALSGAPLRKAELSLRQNQLQLGEVTEAYSLRYEKGLVMAQEPKAEMAAGKGALVSLTLSVGRPPAGMVLMPDFRQKSWEEAQVWARETRLDVTVDSDPQSLSAQGTILEQQPDPDDVLHRGLRIRFLISARPKPSADGDGKRLVYRVPEGGADRRMRVTLVDSSGEREVFQGLRPAGSDLELVLPAGDFARARIYVDDILVEERQLP
ncbi:MAG: PASTA domain-containing protein [Elusimicrobia bacterium]|nr:PASTA domain-containing protein [Elusimicrobiota bacterium]